MRTISVVIAVMMAASIAAAQPGQAPSQPQPPPYGGPPQPPPPPPPGYQPQPQPGYVPPPYAYQPVALNEDDRDLLATGEINDGQVIAGGVCALFIGLGVGQAVEGRWHDTGWIFTLGEPAAMVAFMWGFVEEFNDGNNPRADTLFYGGLIAFAGLHIWEVIDAFAGPPAHNARLHQLRMRLGMPPSPGMYGHVGPYLAPVHGGGGGVAGLTLRF